jgi:hypothetical protein
MFKEWVRFRVDSLPVGAPGARRWCQMNGWCRVCEHQAFPLLYVCASGGTGERNGGTFRWCFRGAQGDFQGRE